MTVENFMTEQCTFVGHIVKSKIKLGAKLYTLKFE